MVVARRSRGEGWEDRMAEVIERHAALPFEWGVSDCACLPMGVCEALTGELPEIWSRDYDTMQGAILRLRERGFKHLGEAFAAAFEECPPALAQRGDIGVASYPGALLGGGVVVIGESVLGKGELGTTRLPREVLTRTFKVGRR